MGRTSDNMFAKTADFILKHSKVIIAIWIVLLACALPFSLKAGEVMQYDITQMSGVETEATAGMLIVNEEFSNTIDLSEILVISYNNADELTQAKAVFAKFSSLMTEKYDKTLTASYYGEYSTFIKLSLLSCVGV